jgi:hypothetical protein
MTIENSKIVRVNKHMNEMSKLFKGKWFPDYEDLYKNLIGFPITSVLLPAKQIFS